MTVKPAKHSLFSSFLPAKRRKETLELLLMARQSLKRLPPVRPEVFHWQPWR